MSQRRPGSTALRAIPICEYSIRRKRISCKFILEEASTQTLFWSVEKCRKNGELSAIERRAWIRNRKEKIEKVPMQKRENKPCEAGAPSGRGLVDISLSMWPLRLLPDRRAFPPQARSAASLRSAQLMLLQFTAGLQTHRCHRECRGALPSCISLNCQSSYTLAAVALF